MDRSTVTLPGPLPAFPVGDRRRRLRHKLHTPVYASFNEPQTGMVVDLSELFDLNEDGFCVQTPIADTELQNAKSIEVNRPVIFCLDFSETKRYVHGSGLVVWRDEAGRTGIRFSFLPDPTKAVLKEWLFVNLMIGCTNHSARNEQLARRRQEDAPKDDRAPRPDVTPSTAIAATVDSAQLLSELDDVRRRITEIKAADGETGKDSTESILRLITERAMTLTAATGCALALHTEGRMVCRAGIGDPAPPVGSEVNVLEGLSGECVSTGQRVGCEDSAADPRVDPELCRVLGIGSFLATPIVSHGGVVGLLEAFSPHAHSFSSIDGAILERLAELVPWQGGRGTALSDHETKAEGESDEPRATEMPTTECLTAGIATEPPATLQQFETETIDAGNPGPPSPELPIRKPGEGVPAEEALDSRTPGGERQSGVRISSLSTTNVPQPAVESPGADVSDAGHTRMTALDDLRVALWERGPDLEQQNAADNSQEKSGKTAKPEWTTSRRSHYVHLGLILSSLAAAALALGYLLAPAIERHFIGTAPTTQAASAGLPVSFRPSDTRKPQTTTPEDLRKLADQGDAEAQFMLGTLYRNGDGVLQNDEQAVEWFQRAANQGYVRALSALGSSYWAGRGVRQDYTQAYFWYQLALAEGDQNSKSLLEGISTQLTREQVASVRQQAETWLHAHNQAGRASSN